jgi:hypothetical protein
LKVYALKHLIALLIISAIHVGCASVPMGDRQQDSTLKTFAVAPDKAGLFIYRNESVALAAKMDVQLDGTPLGHTAAKTYLYTSVAPGKHIITSSAEKTDTLEVDIKAGELTYIWQEIRFEELSWRVKLHLMREEEGRKGVIECKLAKSMLKTQVIEVRVEADDQGWGGPLECQASNSFGIWQFFAPGTVTVQPGASPLQITCNVPAGSAMDASATGLRAYEKLKQSERKGAATGAKVGATAGAALGVAAAPVMGPAFAILLGVGSAFKGAELGGILGAVTAGDKMVYPSPITIHIKRISTTD